MNNEQAQSFGFGDYLVAELRGQIVALSFSAELKHRIAIKQIEMPVAEESVSEVVVEVPGPDAPSERLSSIYGW